MPTVIARAVLPADTFAEGPPAGRWLDPTELHGRQRPFKAQPVQGFSALLPDPDSPGGYLALVDNGFGAIENSADSLLRAYHVRPDFKTGRVEVGAFIQLADPDHRIPFAIVNEFTADRLLTGADFDVESVQRVDDGTLWFGDEFGPYLLHTDAKGRVLEAPIPLPDFERGDGALLVSPQSPVHEEGSVLRVLNAMRADAFAHGAPAPLVSPWHQLVDDGDPTNGAPDRLTAHVSSDLVSVESLKKAGFEVIPYTVDDSARLEMVASLGIRGVITDSPAIGYSFAAQHGLRLPDGRIDRAKFDLQGHRGARGLRPENTLPAFEAGLDALVTTLETDAGLTKDGVPLLSHDPGLDPRKCRWLRGKQNAVGPIIKDEPLATLQRDFVCDSVQSDQRAQQSGLDLSPVSVAFAKERKRPHPYAPVTLEELFDFADFYARWYETGPGRELPNAAARAKNAREVRFSVETKVNPLPVARLTTPDPIALTEAIISVVQKHGLEDRVDVQSFDWRTLRHVYEKAPRIRTVCLIGDFAFEQLGNLAPDQSGNTPWLAGLHWPYRVTKAQTPFRVKTSGGFEGMAYLRAEGVLVPLIEKPLADATKHELIATRFDLGTHRYVSEEFRLPLADRAMSVAELQMDSVFRGYALERDDSQGKLDGYKRLVEIDVDEGGHVTRHDLADLLALKNGLPAATRDVGRQPGDVGLDEPFAFPFWTIEAVLKLDDRHFLIANDNNYPFSVGRHVGTQQPDDDEFIVIEVPPERPASGNP